MAVCLLKATQTPAIQVPSALLDYNQDPKVYPPPGSEIVQYAESRTGTDKINRNADRIDLGARYGGARAFAASEGCKLQAGAGLTVNLTAGAIDIGSHLVFRNGLTWTGLPNNQYSAGDLTRRIWLWITSAGTPVARTDLNPPPGAMAWCAGSCRTNAGAVVDVDDSGVLRLWGGILWRRTADVFVPGDTPPSDLILASESQGASEQSLWSWDGTQWLGNGPGQAYVLKLSTIWVSVAPGGTKIISVDFSPLGSFAGGICEVFASKIPGLDPMEVQIERLGYGESGSQVYLFLSSGLAAGSGGYYGYYGYGGGDLIPVNLCIRGFRFNSINLGASPNIVAQDWQEDASPIMSTPFHHAGLQNTPVAVKGSAGTLYGWEIFNSSPENRYVRIYNKPSGSVVVGTTVPTKVIGVGPGQTVSEYNENGINLGGTGISVAATTGLPDNDSGNPGSTDLIVDLDYV